MNEMYIKVWESDEGYMYSINDHDDPDDVDGLDGGLCTGSMVNAIEMACDQAKELATKIGGKACNGCGRFLGKNSSAFALSRYGHGDLCGDCGTREALEGDFIKAEVSQA